MNTNLQNTKSHSLRSRILLTISLLTLVRLGTFIPVPYIDRETLTTLLQSKTSSSTAIAQALNTFSGSRNNSFGLLSLGILPNINASIIIQLLTTALPSLAKMQKEEGEYGRRKINDYVRYLTFFWAIVESIGVTYSLRGLIFDWSFWTGAQISLTLISGSLIVLWFSEIITRKGLGNGSSLLICLNIISSFPDQLKLVIFSLKNQNNLFLGSLFLIGIFLVTTLGCIYMSDAIIKIPLISARQLLRKKVSVSKDFSNSILPLRINQAGVMPLVFTSYAMVVLSFLVGLIKGQAEVSTFLIQLPFFNETLFYWIAKILFWSVYAALIFFFTYFYSTTVLDPKDIEERFRKNSVVIQGIPPGKATKGYLTKTLKRIASINAIFLISNIVGLQIFESLLNLNLRGLGFTSQLILVNVLIDTLGKIKSFSKENEKTL